MFVNAIEESAQHRPERTSVAAKFIRGEAEMLEFMEQWEKTNVFCCWRNGVGIFSGLRK